jgi:thermitase
VISMSWPLGSPPGDKDVPEFEQLLREATERGAVVVMAAGNTHTNVDVEAIYPTRYSTIPGVVAVGAVIKGEFAKQFSNYGPSYVDLGAPGLVASSGGDYKGALYSVQTGTSFSGPMVAAAASRVIQYLKQKKVGFTAADVERILVAGSKADPKLTPYFKEGRVLDMPLLWAWLEAHYGV